MGRWQEKVGSEQQAIIEQKPKGFHPVETVSLVDGMQDIIAGTWTGIGLLETLPGQQAVWGQQVLIATDDIDRHRLQAVYQGTMIFTPAEFLTVVNDLPESESTIRAKRAFGGVITGGAA